MIVRKISGPRDSGTRHIAPWLRQLIVRFLRALRRLLLAARPISMVMGPGHYFCTDQKEWLMTYEDFICRRKMERYGKPIGCVHLGTWPQVEHQIDGCGAQFSLMPKVCIRFGAHGVYQEAHLLIGRATTGPDARLA
jgi:hypothetical protein